MTEQEISNQVNLAQEISKGKVVFPCVSIERGKISNMCPHLDMEKGCQIGLRMGPQNVECPESKGKITITSTPLIELMGGQEIVVSQSCGEPTIEQSEYAQEIANMEVAIGSDVYCR